MIPSRAVIGGIISIILILLSIYNFTVDNASSTQAWSYLLLTPLPLIFAFKPYKFSKTYLKEDVYDWDEETEEIENKNINPIECGYDVPIL